MWNLWEPTGLGSLGYFRNSAGVLYQHCYSGAALQLGWLASKERPASVFPRAFTR